MKTVIMAGGKGTRMNSVSGTLPKGLLKVAGKPVLAHQIECLASQGFRDIIIVTGHLGDAIQDRLGDGSLLGVRIVYYHEEKPLGTAGALVALKDKLDEDFLLINGDLIFDIDFKRFQAFHHDVKALATLFTHPNNHPFDSAIVIAGSNAIVTGWLSASDKRPACKNRVNAGIHIISPLLLADKTQVAKLDLDTGIIIPALDSRRIFIYDSPEYVKDMGTPKRYKEVCEDYAAGRVHAKNLSNKQRAVFLDRDGTVNTYKGLITKAEQITLIEGSAQAIAKINDSGYLAILITNQPVIARGDCTLEELEQIHDRLECLLGKHGAYLDAIFYCPHHPDEGFNGERLEYKIDCDCRKPKPGMILQAAKDYNIDLSLSYMVGDDVKDVLAGKAAGCAVGYLHSGKPYEEPVHASEYKDLLDFINHNI